MNIAATIQAPEEKQTGTAANSVTAPAQGETLIEAAERSPAIPAPGILLDGEADKTPALRKTRGEWFYDIAQQLGGKGAIIAATAYFAYIARYGKDKYGPVPNVLKKFEHWFHDVLMHNPVYPIAQKGEVAKRLAGAAANTMVTFHGGNVFSPIMKWMENNRENIANWYNRHWGKPGDVEIAHERLKNEPQQTWGDVIKGRIAAWLLVFSTFAVGDMLLGKGKLFGKGSANKYRFDQYEEAFGRWLAGFTKNGKELWHTPLAKELTEVQKQNKVYQFGKITALDFYATNAGIIIWSFFSRRSAQERKEKQAALAGGNGAAENTVETKPAVIVPAETEYMPSQLKSFADSMAPSESHAQTAISEKAKASEAQMVQSA